MASKSPLDIKYQDLINQAESVLNWMKKSYPRMVTEQRLSSWTAQHNIAAQTAIVKLLKKYKRNPQTDLFKQIEP